MRAAVQRGDLLPDGLAGPNGVLLLLPSTLDAYVAACLRARTGAAGGDDVGAEWVHRLGVHVLPVMISGRELGQMPLDAISRLTVEHWVGHAENVVQAPGKPYASETVAGWWRLLCQVLRDATADYDLPDPTRRAIAPKVFVPKVRESRTLQRPQLEKFMAAVEAPQSQRYAELSMLAYPGCSPARFSVCIGATSCSRASIRRWS